MNEIKIDEEFILTDCGEKYKAKINKDPYDNVYYIDYERI